MAVKHGKPVVVMEAIKGGTLVNIPEEAQKLMKDYNPDASIASWALRFVGSLPGVRAKSALTSAKSTHPQQKRKE